ncbi:unnamed protein product, partial [Discosporangium mesarthrocarpum]
EQDLKDLGEAARVYERALELTEKNRTPGPVTGRAEVAGSPGFVENEKKFTNTHQVLAFAWRLNTGRGGCTQSPLPRGGL